eukprot:CCRYP_009628-RB/>CCRYP_009628-RB protein AED:0.05 eAED:0.05 QI:89/1/1/1/1/1/2/432/225
MSSLSFQILGCSMILTDAFVPPTAITQHIHRHHTRSEFNPSQRKTFPPYAFIDITALSSSPFDDFLGGIFGNDGNKQEKIDSDQFDQTKNDGEDDLSLSSFQQELTKRQKKEETASDVDPEGQDEEFSGYDLRDIIFTKYGECFDVEFQRVDSYGFRSVYLNIMPFRLGGKRFRHETEYDYLCHLQAVVSSYHLVSLYDVSVVFHYVQRCRLTSGRNTSEIQPIR